MPKKSTITEMQLPGEEWRDVPGYEGYYQVSNKGRVKATGWYKEARIKAPSINNRGYQLVSLYKNRKIKNFLVHRLVMLAFSPIDDPDKMHVNHIDLNKMNCLLENLEWCSNQENMDHFYRSDKAADHRIKSVLNPEILKRGEDHYRSKLTEKDVIEMRKLYADGLRNMSELGRRFGVAGKTARSAIVGETWKHLLPDAKANGL